MPRVASVQMDVVFNNPAENASRIIEHIASLGRQGVELAIFPECVLTGYCVSSASDAANIAISRDSVWVSDIQAACDQHNVIAVIGFAERGQATLHNTAVLCEPGVESRFYEKTHLPELGYDRFVEAGNLLQVFGTKVGRIGILICFDCRAPEATRSLALQGADLIALPTNWPTGAEVSANILVVARAVENRVFVVSANRVGNENGFHFFGQSKIIDPTGKVVEQAGADEQILISEADFQLARVKRIVVRPGEHETTVFESRRPELYGELLRHNDACTTEMQ